MMMKQFRKLLPASSNAKLINNVEYLMATGRKVTQVVRLGKFWDSVPLDIKADPVINSLSVADWMIIYEQELNKPQPELMRSMDVIGE